MFPPDLRNPCWSLHFWRESNNSTKGCLILKSPSMECSKTEWMWHFAICFREHGGVWLKVGFDLGSVFQPYWWCDSCLTLVLWAQPLAVPSMPRAVLPHSAHGIDSPSCRLWSIPGQLCGSWEGHAEHTSTAPGTLKGHCTPGCIHCSGQALNSCCLALGRLYWDNCAQSKTTPEMLLEWCESCGGQVSLSENWDTPEEKQRGGICLNCPLRGSQRWVRARALRTRGVERSWR